MNEQLIFVFGAALFGGLVTYIFQSTLEYRKWRRDNVRKAYEAMARAFVDTQTAISEIIYKFEEHGVTYQGDLSVGDISLHAYYKSTPFARKAHEPIGYLMVLNESLHWLVFFCSKDNLQIFQELISRNEDFLMYLRASDQQLVKDVYQRYLDERAYYKSRYDLILSVGREEMLGEIKAPRPSEEIL